MSVTSSSLKELDNRVRKALAEGWELYGTLLFAENSYVQTMIKTGENTGFAARMRLEGIQELYSKAMGYMGNSKEAFELTKACLELEETIKPLL
jgi:Domain of unknown function (DUF1737)